MTTMLLLPLPFRSLPVVNSSFYQVKSSLSTLHDSHQKSPLKWFLESRETATPDQRSLLSLFYWSTSPIPWPLPFHAVAITIGCGSYCCPRNYRAPPQGVMTAASWWNPSLLHDRFRKSATRKQKFWDGEVMYEIKNKMWLLNWTAFLKAPAASDLRISFEGLSTFCSEWLAGSFLYNARQSGQENLGTHGMLTSNCSFSFIIIIIYFSIFSS